MAPCDCPLTDGTMRLSLLAQSAVIITPEATANNLLKDELLQLGSADTFAERVLDERSVICPAGPLKQQSFDEIKAAALKEAKRQEEAKRKEDARKMAKQREEAQAFKAKAKSMEDETDGSDGGKIGETPPGHGSLRQVKSDSAVVEIQETRTVLPRPVPPPDKNTNNEAGNAEEDTAPAQKWLAKYWM